jgi:hypothetical protein
MKTETLLRGGVAMSLLTCTILMFFLAESQRKLDESQTTLKLTQDALSIEKIKSDSLYEENFIKSVDINRDELTWDYVKEKFPNVYNNAMNYKSHETE